jgi:hypothetical protein
VVPSAGFLLAIAVLVLYLAVTHKDSPDHVVHDQHR